MDASALVKLVVPEQETRPLRRSILGRATVSSEIVVVEVLRAAARQSTQTAALERAKMVLARLTLLKLDEATLHRAGELSPPALRSLDAIHLAAALSLGDDLAAMVVYDQRLAAAATEAGIRVLAPA